MKIMNVMLSRGRGGIQQAFLNYNKLIKYLGFHLIAVTSYGAKISSEVSESFSVPNLFNYDPISILSIGFKIKTENPAIIIAHGNRAINFVILATMWFRKKPIIIGVAHNYSYKYIIKCDHIFCLTSNQLTSLLLEKISPQKLHLMPNFIDTQDSRINRPLLQTQAPCKLVKADGAKGPEVAHKAHEDQGTVPEAQLQLGVEFPEGSNIDPPKKKVFTIGAMGRLVKKKGFDVLIRAVYHFVLTGESIKLIIAGDGEERDNLRKLTKLLSLDEYVKFTGWASDKEKFFRDIDVFCLPSIEEPFGIIILEAMLNHTPIIATRTDGPLDLIENNHNGILVNINSTEEFLEAIVKFKQNKDFASNCAKNAYKNLLTTHNIENATILFSRNLNKIINNEISNFETIK
ncbi:MAG: glycosyltransferase [Rickettsiaceae bacterium]|nr:glycosyltransferase [Rickettsiaceae bacterium]